VYPVPEIRLSDLGRALEKEGKGETRTKDRAVAARLNFDARYRVIGGFIVPSQAHVNQTENEPSLVFLESRLSPFRSGVSEFPRVFYYRFNPRSEPPR